ncbi:hypothetical protein WJX73_006721 [Symbiochloris irregularis]|uniref:Zinc-finger domain-containing protein n=1 Tax=Symbiochloris irregularis TaxID=706552 RepID=A0AAW1PVX2_9CHLO
MQFENNAATQHESAQLEVDLRTAIARLTLAERPRSLPQTATRDTQQWQQSHSTDGTSGLLRAAEVEVTSLSRYHDRIGPNLRQLRKEQLGREFYTLQDYDNLQRFESAKRWTLPKGDYCSDVHGKPCRACSTCHFCRQKTTTPSTKCSCGHGRGRWCANCLDIRMGQHLDEVNARPFGEWRCPCCLGLCNCSAPDCQRACALLAPTRQLYSEAQSLGYRSVAHYLVLTQLSSDSKSMPADQLAPLMAKHKQSVSLSANNRAPKQARLGQYRQTLLGKRAEQSSMDELRKVFSVLSGMPEPVAKGWHVLDQDDADEDEQVVHRPSLHTTGQGIGKASRNSMQAPVTSMPTTAPGPESAPHLPRMTNSIAPPAAPSMPGLTGHTSSLPTSSLLYGVARHPAAAKGSGQAQRRQVRQQAGGQENEGGQMNQAEHHYDASEDGPHAGLAAGARRVALRRELHSGGSLAAAPREAPGPAYHLPAEMRGDPEPDPGADFDAELAEHQESMAFEVGIDDLEQLLDHFDKSLEDTVAISAFDMSSLPLPDQIDHFILRRITNQEHFVDFSRSDVRARAHLLDAAFKLMDCLSKRDMEVGILIDQVNIWLDITVREYEELQGASKRLKIGEEFHIGPIKFSKVLSPATVQHLDNVVDTVLEGDLNLLLLGLEIIAARCSSHPARARHLMGPSLLSLLKLDRPHVKPKVRHLILDAIQKTLVAAGQLLSGAEAASQAFGLGMWLDQDVSPLLEELMWLAYPLRKPHQASAAQIFGASAQPQDLGKLGMVPVVMGRLKGFLVKLGIQDWQQVHACARSRFLVNSLERTAPLVYRRLAVCLLSNALKEHPGLAKAPVAAQQLLRLWLVVLLDAGGRNSLADLTQVLASNPHLERHFWQYPDAPLSLQELKSQVAGDHSGIVRGVLVSRVLATARRMWTERALQDMVSGLHDMIALRAKDIATEPRFPAWEEAAARILINVAKAVPALLSKQGAVQGGTAHELSGLLQQLSLMMQRSARRMIPAAQTQHEQEADPTCMITDIGTARRHVQSSTLQHMGDLLALATTSHSDKRALMASEIGMAMLEALRMALGAYLEGQPAGAEISHAEQALHEALADDLLQQAAARPHLNDTLLHFVLSTFVRRWLEESRAVARRSAAENLAAERTAVSVVRWLQVLLLPSPAAPAWHNLVAKSGNDETFLLRLLLPPLMGPLLDALGGDGASLATKHAIYSLLRKLQERWPCLIPAPAPISLSETMPTFPTLPPVRFGKGDLQHGRSVPQERFEAALHGFHWAACRDAVSSIAYIALPAGQFGPLEPLDQQGLQHAQNLLVNALCQPRSMQQVNQLYARNAAAGAQAPQNSAQQGHSSADLPVEEDPEVRLARAAFDFFRDMAQRGDSGLQWASMAAHSICSLMRTASAVPDILIPKYVQLLAILSSLAEECDTQPQAASNADMVGQAGMLPLDQMEELAKGKQVSVTALIKSREPVIRQGKLHMKATLQDGHGSAVLFWVDEDCRQLSALRQALEAGKQLVVALLGLVKVVPEGHTTLAFKATAGTIVDLHPASDSADRVRQWAAVNVPEPPL